jgi:hypothetical protein
MLRNGAGMVTLSCLMGHAGLKILKRYLAQNDLDIQESHQRGSPVDNADW